jgi:hypothetical protein
MIPRERVLDLLSLTKIVSRDCQFDGLFSPEQRLNSADCLVALPLPSLNFPNPTTAFLNEFTAFFATDGLIATRLLRDTNERRILASRGLGQNMLLAKPLLLASLLGVILLGTASLQKRSPYQW